MLEEALDPRPVANPDFARLLGASSAGELDYAEAVKAWRRYWNDDEDAWANLQRIEHWIERSRR